MYERLKDLREDKNKTQKDIAEIINMSRTGYNQYETEKNDIPTKLLCYLLKCFTI